MAEPTEASEPVATTPVPEWIIPNQAKFEQVIDARLEKLKNSEKPTRSRATGSAAKADSKDDPKS